MSSLSSPVVAHKLKHILLATDFSTCSQKALLYARAIAQQFDSNIHVVHVIAPEPQLEVPLDRPPELDTDKHEAELGMKSFLANDLLKSVQHQATIERGPVWEVIAALIQKEDIDLVVTGTHGRRGFKKLVLGSVAEQIFRHAPCPVLTVGPEVKEHRILMGRFARILYTTDFSAGSVHALRYAVSLAQENESDLMLLHVVERGPQYLSDLVNDAQQGLKDLVAETAIEQLQPALIADYGLAADTILRIAKEHRADLIVMGAHRAVFHSASAHLPWATASIVTSQAECPVLTVRS